MRPRAAGAAAPSLRAPSRPDALGRALAIAVALAVLPSCKAKGGAGESSAAVPSEARPVPPPPLDTSWKRDPGRLLSVGETAPDFEGIAHTGMRVRLSSMLERPVVVCFYPTDRSPEALALLDALRDGWLRLTGPASMVLGVSADDRVLHRDVATEHELPFLLVADADLSIARAFGVKIEGGRPETVAFVIAPDRKVTSVLSGLPAADAVTTLLQALSAGR